MKSVELKTNAMRILEKAHIRYTAHEYQHGKEVVDGVQVAALLAQDPARVFKTLVARGKSGAILVFAIPVACALDLKKAARASGEKAVELVHVREITALTGYVRGGCSPVGMKKAYTTILHQTAAQIPSIIVSAGKIGYQIELDPQSLMTLVDAQASDIITDII